jgi:hypothetical protein
MITLLKQGTGTFTYQQLLKNGISTGFDIASTTSDVYDDIKDEFKDGGKIIPNMKIPYFIKVQLKIFGELVERLSVDKGSYLDDDDIENITINQMNEERVNYKLNANSVNTFNPTPVTSNNTIIMESINNNTNIELKEFRKGIKRDATQYPVLKDEQDFSTWIISFMAIARTHQINDVFDPNYVAINVHDQELFNEKQQFAFIVLNTTLKINMGKTLV